MTLLAQLHQHNQQLAILKADQIQQLLDHPKCLQLADLCGHMPYQVVVCDITGTPGICSPFFKAPLVTDHTQRYWEQRLDRYIDTLAGCTTLEGLIRLRVYTERAYLPYMMAYLHGIGTYDPAQFDRGQWWELLKDTWRDSEAIHGEKEHDFAYLFNLLPTTKRLTRDLPRKFKIYRGGHPDGDSWTLSREKAQWFSMMRCADKQYKGQVQEKTITRDQALFYDNDREEQEVLLKTILNKSLTLTPDLC